MPKIDIVRIQDFSQRLPCQKAWHAVTPSSRDIHTYERLYCSNNTVKALHYIVFEIKFPKYSSRLSPIEARFLASMGHIGIFYFDIRWIICVARREQPFTSHACSQWAVAGICAIEMRHFFLHRFIEEISSRIHCIGIPCLCDILERGHQSTTKVSIFPIFLYHIFLICHHKNAASNIDMVLHRSRDATIYAFSRYCSIADNTRIVTSFHFDEISTR